MLLGNNHSRQENIPQENEGWILQLMSDGCYAEAYLLLKKEQAGRVSSRYNLALCCYFAGEYQQALYRLDEALSVFRPMPGHDAMQKDDVYKALIIAQNKTDSYRKGIDEKYVSHFPDMMKDNILRLKVDCFLVLKQWNKLIETAALLRTKDYRNVAEALAAEKIKN